MLIIISLLAINCWLVAFPAAAQEPAGTTAAAGEATMPEEEITTADLEVENPGILPSSPFYFLKEWRRQIQNFFTFDPVKKAQQQLEQANERAAEIKKLEEVAPSNIEAISKAIENYRQNMERLETRLEELKETSQNPKIDQLLDKLIDRSIKHQELFDDLKTRFEQRTELREKLKAGEEIINEVISKIPQRLENVAAFEERLKNRIESLPENPVRELRVAEMLNKIEEKLPEQEQKIKEIRENLIQRIENRLENWENIAATTTAKERIQRRIQEFKKERERICAQVITPAVSPEGECREFSTPCDVPDDWKRVNSCPTTGISVPE